MIYVVSRSLPVCLLPSSLCEQLFVSSGGRVVWGHVFRRNITEVEEGQCQIMLALLCDVYMLENTTDRRAYLGTMSSSFSVVSCFPIIRERSLNPIFLSSLWKIKAPLRVLSFGWVPKLGCILTMDNLRKLKIIIVMCALCVSLKQN